MNPNMMGMGMQPMPDVPTVRQLWSDEKSKYRHWVILFAISLIAIFSLLAAVAILNYLSSGNIKDTMKEYVTNNYKNEKLADELKSIDSTFRMQYLIVPSIQAALVGVGLVLFIVTILEVYKKKNFARLSGFPTAIVGIGAIVSFINIATALFKGKGMMFESTGGIFQFIVGFVVLGAYFAGSMQISKIRRVFMMSERIEKIKSSPEYAAAQQQMQAMMNQQQSQQQTPPMNSPYGPAAPTQSTTASTTQTQVPQPVVPQPVQPQISKEHEELNKMKVTELRKVAKELSISGAQSMKKEELINSILRVTNKK